MHTASEPVTGHRLDPRACQVVEAAAILDISEYELLAMAFREWYGRPPRREDLDPLFGPYMFEGVTPFWAVSLARRIIALYQDGRLRQSRYRAPARPPATLRDVITGVGQSLLLLALFGLIWYAASVYVPFR